MLFHKVQYLSKLVWNSIQTHPECPVLPTRLVCPTMESGSSGTMGKQTGVTLKAHLLSPLSQGRNGQQEEEGQPRGQHRCMKS